MPIKAFLYLMYLSRRFPPPIFAYPSMFYRVSRIDLLLSIESRIDGPSVGQAPVLLHVSSPSFSRIHLTRAPSSVFRSLPLVALSSPLYDFSVSSTSVSFTRILSISQSAKRRTTLKFQQTSAKILNYDQGQ